MNILFVCLGNICRSPTADGVFTQRIKEAGLFSKVHVDSAGTSAWHSGSAPDKRSQQAAKARGYDLSKLRARQVERGDFYDFDLILAMDGSNLRDLQALKPNNAKAEIDLFLRRYQITPFDVPDPYQGGAAGFEQVLDLIEAGSRALLAEVKQRL
ncbi:protein-tyrosine-phosphatase [Ventosimonas gracilis]|uniref:protein-tyrosine-phosphatase n=1 Tax=Ventosimonas gracilis TaxID=1680762 RepID=A0A139SY07_9GAMM|nr:low molecular weight protein-tyrosine-phosphatase [Ventosimonas gracilis]KXU39505.1 protein-tyrosine-phosphatase [Ventosimonas gracilis]